MTVALLDAAVPPTIDAENPGVAAQSAADRISGVKGGSKFSN